MSGAPLSPLLARVAAIAEAAGRAIMDVYASDFAVEHKDDHSPLTAADLAAQTVIAQGLAALDDVLPVISEEARTCDWDVRRSWNRYWLVDPLDGTREFVKRNGEFTVNIALIDNHRSVLGVVLAPVTGELYVAEQGQGAWLQTAPGGSFERIRTRALAQPPVLAGSRSHGGAHERELLDSLLGKEHRLVPLGSSLKFCLIARGAADVYLRLGLTSEWDTAAAQCVLQEAGGAVLDLQGRPFTYNRGESLLNPEFIAVGDAGIDWVARLAKSDQSAASTGE
jgi:3'(2'), 5'-bisphosphate nucleotidase